jgi:hypothetical protein
MFNIFDWILAGLIYLFDLMLIPTFTFFATLLGGFNPVDMSIMEYVRFAFRLVYPLVMTLNFLPFAMAASLAISISIGRKFVSVYMFIVDLIPGLR